MESYHLGMAIAIIGMFTSIGIGLYYVNVQVEELIDRRESESVSFKSLTCTEKQSYLLENDYTEKQRDYYIIECGTAPIGDWDK